MKCQIGIPIIRNLFIPMQLKMILPIIILFVVVELGISIFIGIDSRRIKGSVRLQCFCIYPVPSLIGNFMSPEQQCLYQSIVINIGALQKVRIQFGRSPINITVRGYSRQTSCNFNMIVQKTGAKLQIVPECSKAAYGRRNLTKGLVGNGIGQQI